MCGNHRYLTFRVDEGDMGGASSGLPLSLETGNSFKSPFLFTLIKHNHIKQQKCRKVIEVTDGCFDPEPYCQVKRVTKQLTIAEWPKVKKKKKKKPVSKPNFWPLQQIPSFNLLFIWRKVCGAAGSPWQSDS